MGVINMRNSTSLVSAALYLARSLAGPVLDKISLRNDATLTSVMPDINFADPMVYFDGNKYWAFATQNGSTKIQVAQSDSASKNWHLLMDGDKSYEGLTRTGSWSTGQNVWAPSVFQNINGQYVMYYSAAMASSTGQHCIGVAISNSVQGPYVPYVGDNGDVPLPNCDLGNGGSIDGSVFLDPKDNNRVYLVYKVDGNNVNKPTPIMLQRMSYDGLTIDKYSQPQPQQLITNDAADGPVVEAPNIIYINEKYVLFFSSNAYNTPLYDVSYAYTADLLTTDGWTKTTTPLLKTNNPFGGMTAPGGASALVNSDGVTGDLYFHANCPGVDSSSAKRCMYYIPITSEVDDSGAVSIHYRYHGYLMYM